ncbi:MAG: hypothetical protein HY566_01555 [Candidatus Kerfeldbacteria bacterium]|nr:hypothetical protein [Candidatus Kerfeldbacteria bacterium]
MSQTALRWRRECRRNGHDKRRHTLLLDSAALLLTIVQDAQRYRRSFRFR